jgi:HAE1 family hydrophobic/amphiphilic exporter-1
MYFAGFTLNTISFGGLALGVGMLVDNAIVVLENIFRRRETGEGILEAAMKGSSEVAGAITASTLTTVAVFVPVVFTTGISSVTFRQLAIVVSFSLLCSLAVALTVVPVLCSRFLRPAGQARRVPVIAGVSDWAEAAQERLNNRYGHFIEKALAHPKATAATAAVLFAGSLLLVPLVGVELSPQADEGEVRINVQLEPGTRVQITDAVMQEMVRKIKQAVPESRNIMVESGDDGSEHVGELRVQLVPRAERDRSARDIAMAMRPLLAGEPGMVVRTRVQTSFFNRMMSSAGGDRLVVEIRGHDLQKMSELGLQVRDAMLSIPGVPEAQLNKEPGTPEVVLRVDRLKAATLGLNVSDIADAMEATIGGRRTSMFRQGGDEYAIMVRLQEQDRLDVEQVLNVPLVTAGGQTIPARSVVDLTRQEGPVHIERIDQERIITVSGSLGDRDLGTVIDELDGKLRQIPKPDDIRFVYGGEYEEQQEAFLELTVSAILAVLLVYMVMAAQFESLRDPFIILFSVPVSAVGVLWTLVLTDTTFNMQGFLGVIMLAGIVVNNAIILVDYANQLRRNEGYSLREALVTAGTRRLRPVLMTTTTTVLGLLPMAMGIGEGSELQAPMARVVIGGLISSTLITLVLIPAIYYLVERSAERREREQTVPVGLPQPQQAGD